MVIKLFRYCYYDYCCYISNCVLDHCEHLSKILIILLETNDDLVGIEFQMSYMMRKGNCVCLGDLC